MGITHLRSIAISAQDPESLLPFYEDTWGLRDVGRDDAGRIFLRANSSEHHVVTLVPGPGRKLEGLVLAADSAAFVDELAASLPAAGSEIVEGPGARSNAAGGGYGVTFLDPEGRVVEVCADVATWPVTPDVPGPDRLSHIVLNTIDLENSKHFYTEVLGFKISDSYENDYMIFMRCNEMHHCVVLAPGKWTSLNHVAFEVQSSDDVMRALGRLRQAGFESVWGPGRHGPGGNVFAYFKDPVGNVIEYTAELHKVDEATWQPQVWELKEENADVWGLAGRPDPSVRDAMANPPLEAEDVRG